MDQLKLRHLYFLIITFVPQFSWAAIGFEDAVYPELITSARALAMGNAYICKTDDSGSAFYNPAGFGTTRYGHFHLSNIHVQANKGWLSTSGRGAASKVAGSITDSFKPDGVREMLAKDKGKISHNRFHLNPNFTMRFFSVGYLYSKQIRATIGQAPDAKFEYADRFDRGPYASLTLPLFGGIIKFGGTATLLSRREAIGEAVATDTLNLQDSDYKAGTATIFTGGARLSLPISLLPTFAFKINNASSQVFKPKDGYGGAPDKIQQSMDIGFSVTPQIGKSSRFHMELNYKDLAAKHKGTASSRRFAFGAELDMARSFFVRFGYGDGFGSGGVGVRSKKIEFDLTTYATDATTSEFRGKEDRHFVFSLSAGF